MITKERSVIVKIVWALMCSGALSADETVAMTSPDFNTHVLPILRTYCVACHGSDDPEGGLALESYEQLLQGGKHGAVISPQRPDASRLLLVLSGGAEPAMPPEGNESPKDADLQVIHQWIAAGAKSPSGEAPDPRKLVTPRFEPRVTPKRGILAAAFAPDGKTFALAIGHDVWLHSVESRGLVRKFSDHIGPVNAVAFSSDGTRLVTGAGEPGLFGEARAWEVASGNLLKRFEGHRDGLYAVAISPDGNTLATAGYDQKIKLWDINTASEQKTLDGHSGAIFSLAFRPDGKVLASASADRTVKLWDVLLGTRLDTFGQALQELQAVAFSADGQFVAAGGMDNRIRVWQLSATAQEGTNTLRHTRFAHQGAILQLAYSADGKSLVSTADDRTVRIWNATDLTERKSLDAQSDWPTALAIASDNVRFLIGRHDGTLQLLQLDNGATIPPAAPSLASVSPRVIQRGVTTRVKVIGKNLLDIKSVDSNERMTAKPLHDEAKNAEVAWAEITPVNDLPRGKQELTVTTPGGTSGKIAIEVESLPQWVEQEPNNGPLQAPVVTLPVMLQGVLDQKGDVDSIRFRAHAGETLVFDAIAKSIGSDADIVLTLSDDRGRVIASSNDSDGSVDPLLTYQVPSDGDLSLQVNDLQMNGSEKHSYRVALGALPYVVGVFPLSVSANAESPVELIGYNLAPNERVNVQAPDRGEMTVPLDAERYRMRKAPKVAVGEFPEFLESEPNNASDQAQRLTAPATVNGRIWAVGMPTDDDFFRIECQAGESWIIETDADRRGSPLDTKLEILTADGQPIPRIQLQAVRDAAVTFRSINSSQVEVRTTNWEEMELNQFLYMNGEVCKLFRMPQGPDSGFNFYNWQGRRIGYFDTSGTTHPVDEPCYIVEPYPAGQTLASTGLPVFQVYFANDDDGQRKLGRDSQVTFVAPATGSYLVRVADVRGQSGPDLAYRLTVRRPAPDFTVSVGGANPSVPAGSGRKITFTVDRRDGFDGPIELSIAKIPAGLRLASPIVIEAGQIQATAVLHAEPEAKSPSDEQSKAVEITAMAEINGNNIQKPFGSLGTIRITPKPKLIVQLDPAEITIAPGQSTTATLRVERNGVDAAISFEVNNLPHGIIVDNIGLNGVLIPEGQSERQLFLIARDWVPESTRDIHAVATTAGGEASAPIKLHVRKSNQLVQVPPNSASSP
jgi:hypothetical protein